MRNTFLSVLLFLVSFGFTASYERLVNVGPGEDYTTISQGISACSGAQSCEIAVAPGTYAEQLTITAKNIWLHGDLNDPTAVVVRYKDTLSTFPHSNNEGENNYLLFPERNGVIRLRGDSSRVSHLTVDGVEKWPFQWENVWGSEYQFYGNNGIAIGQAEGARVDHCEIKNTWYGIYLKGRNTGGVFANLDTWEVQEGKTTTPFSDFGKDGGHIIEHNRIYDNAWAVYIEQTYDIGSTFRYNLAWDNFTVNADFLKCTDATLCGDPNLTDGDKRYQNGGFALLKDAMLVPHIFHNNTLYNMPHVLAGYHKAGKNHVVFNNIIAQHDIDLSQYHGVGQNSSLIGGYTNAHNNVMERNANGTSPLFGTSDDLWTHANLPGAGSASPDTFDVGSQNYYYEVVNFQNTTTPSDPGFLCPDWTDPDVQATILGQGWAFTGGVTADTRVDIGALWQDNTGSGCQTGGSTDSVGLLLTAITPVIFYDQTHARFQFEIEAVNTPDSSFSSVAYDYAVYIDSLPFTSTGTSEGPFPEAQPVPGSTGLTGAVQMGLNQQEITLPRTSLGEYGVIYVAVKGRHNGKDYISNIEAFQYRRLDYTIDLKLYRQSDLAKENPLDTVAKGDTVVVVATILDLDLQPVLDQNVFFTGNKSTAGDGTVSYASPTIKSLLNNSFRILNPLDSAFSVLGTGLAVVTGSTWGTEIMTVSGYIHENNVTNTPSKFASGAHIVYINPAYASELEIEEGNRPYAGDTVTYTVNVLDVFGDLSGDSVVINLSSPDPNVAQVIFPNKINSDGTVEYDVILRGAPGDSITLTASTTSEAGDISADIRVGLINPPGKIYFVEGQDSLALSTGSLVEVDLEFRADNGTSWKQSSGFIFEIYDSEGEYVDFAKVYVDSASAATRGMDIMNGTGSAYVLTDTSGTITLWVYVPDTVSQSDDYTFMTKSSAGAGQQSEEWDFINVYFGVPELVFVDNNGDVLDPLPGIDTTTNYLVDLHLQARLNDQVCNNCNDSVVLTSNDSLGYIRFKKAEGTPDLSYIKLNAGQADFYVYGLRQTLNTSFTVSSRGGASELTWDDVNFRKPPVPQVDSALIFDSDGDGIGDSILVYYEVNIRDSLPDSLYYAFPGTSESNRLLPNSSNLLPGTDSVIVISGQDLTQEILTQGVGLLESWYTDSDGVIWRQPVDIQDRMGPVVKSAKLIENFTGQADSLIVVFSEPIDPNSSFSTPFIVDRDGNENRPPMLPTQLDDTTWVFTLTKGLVVENDLLSLDPTGGVRDEVGNPPADGNPGVAVSLIRRPIPPTQKGNLFQDRNGDGRLDYITLEFLGDMSAEYLSSDLDSVVFTWLDSNGRVLELVARGEDFTIDPENPRLLHWSLPDEGIIAPHMTWIDESRDSSSQYGAARMYTSIEGEFQTLDVRMTDAMPPVIWKAVLDVGDNPQANDLMNLLFSEPVNPDEISPLLQGQEFEIKTVGSTEPRVMEYSKIEWLTPEEAQLTFGRDIPYNSRPNSLDSVRIAAGAIPDLVGNVPLSDEELAELYSSDFTRSFTVIRGGVRFRLESIPLASFNPADPELEQREAMDLIFVDYDTQRESLPELGTMTAIGGQDLEFDIQEALKSEKYADDDVDAANIPVDSANLKIHMQLTIYTNISGFVSNAKETIACNDYRFSDSPSEGTPGNCIEHPKKLFLRWNSKTSEGRLAGSGAYIAWETFKVTYTDEEKGSVKLSDREETSMWGLRRTSDPRLLGN